MPSVFQDRLALGDDGLVQSAPEAKKIHDAVPVTNANVSHCWPARSPRCWCRALALSETLEHPAHQGRSAYFRTRQMNQVLSSRKMGIIIIPQPSRSASV
ncbi:hypothetical protein EJB05_10511, partial [Eragrostis curvula]